MANVMSALARAADEDMLRQVAILEVVTIRNIVGTEGMKAVDKAAGLVNSVGRMLGAKKRLVKDVQPRSIAEQIEEKVEERSCDSRETLDEIFRALLTERLGLDEDAGGELISRELAEQAADYLEIEEEMTPAELADAVFETYGQRLEEKLGLALGEDWESIRQQLEQAQKFDLWQYLRDFSSVDGEICCRLVLLAGFLHGRTFAPQDSDLPDWLTGGDEDARQEWEDSYISYQERSAELEEARAKQAAAEQKLRAALGSEEGSRKALSQHLDYLAVVQEQVENFDSNRLNAEIELGVLEGQLVMAAKAKKSSLTINKLKKAILGQREKIARLKQEHEENLITLEEAPERESQLRKLIEEAEEETGRKRAAAQAAAADLADAQKARDELRSSRREHLREGLARWLEQEYGSQSCQLDEVFLNQLAMNCHDLDLAVLKAMKQVLDAEDSAELGEQVSESSWRLPLKGTGLFLIYARGEEEICFLRFTEGESLKELQREREERGTPRP